MATFCYSHDGTVVEKQFLCGYAPDYIVEDGIVYRRDYAAEHPTPTKPPSGWPIECIASGVGAHQANDLRDFFRKHGENCEVSRDGNPIYTDSRQRKRLLKLRGFVDRSSYC